MSSEYRVEISPTRYWGLWWLDMHRHGRYLQCRAAFGTRRRMGRVALRWMARVRRDRERLEQRPVYLVREPSPRPSSSDPRSERTQPR